MFIIYDQRQILLTDDLHSLASRDNFVARVFHGEMSSGVSGVHLFMYYFRHIRYKGRRDVVADDKKIVVHTLGVNFAVLVWQ